jgi:acyl carrier protein
LDTPYVSSQNETEKELVEIWENVLEVRPIGIHDNFFDLGGHSLTASQIVSHVFQRFKLQIPLQALFQSATVADMVAVIAAQKRLGNEELENSLNELESLSDAEAQQLLSQHSQRDSKS